MGVTVSASGTAPGGSATRLPPHQAPGSDQPRASLHVAGPGRGVTARRRGDRLTAARGPPAVRAVETGWGCC